MSVTVVLLGLAALSGDLPPPVAADPSAVRALPQDSWDSIRGKLAGAIEQKRLEEALLLTKALLAHPDSAALSEAERRPFLWLQALLNLELGRPAVALPTLDAITASPDATFEQWTARLDANSQLQNYDAAASTLTEILHRFPSGLGDLNQAFVLGLAMSSEGSPEVGFALREALHKARWINEDASWIWLKLVDDYIDHDRSADAASVFARVTDPSARLQLFAMRRYDAVRPTGAVLNIDAAWAGEIALARKAADRPDAAVKARNRLASSLFAVDRLDEALALVDAILAGPEPEAGTAEADDYTWVLNTRSRILMALGRSEDAVTQQQAAAARLEYGAPNVSQQINLAWTYLRLDRPREAFDAVKGMETERAMSAYGKMQVWQVRACAARGVDDLAAAEADEALLAEHWRDAPVAALDAHACREDEDAMARLLIEALADPETASSMVESMHAYLDAEPTDWDRRMAARHRRVMARPEVIAARDAVGRAFTVPTRGPQF
jgi:tetratricopeptide (TPR) repeat protein